MRKTEHDVRFLFSLLASLLVLGDNIYEEYCKFVEQLEVHQVDLFYIGNPFG